MDALHHVTQPAPAASAGAPLVEVRATEGGHGVFALRAIAPGTRLFGEDDWTDDEERKRFSSLSADQVQKLTPAMRALFLRFAYNSTPERISGTFHPEAVSHAVNFLNHGCDPNAGYDGADHIVGPLTRDAVSAVFARGRLAVPVLALKVPAEIARLPSICVLTVDEVSDPGVTADEPRVRSPRTRTVMPAVREMFAL